MVDAWQIQNVVLDVLTVEIVVMSIESDSKVIPLKSFKEKREKKAKESLEGSEEVFADAIEKNAKVKEKLRRERNKANKGVLDSYRLK